MLARCSAALLLALFVLACAARSEPVPPPRPDPTRGWIELRLADTKVPADPISLDGAGSGQPPPCHLMVELGGLSVLSSPIEPEGGRPPFSVDSTFRFAAPVGRHSATVTYAGCRTFGNQLDSRVAKLPISVWSGQVTYLHFDGSTLQARTLPGPVE